ncbi:MAG: type VI secretion system tip protein VgrG [Polyangiaceae bacterium]|nr:type VI secretion system tip protein VgrG [Polyangiaceae bacterium]
MRLPELATLNIPSFELALARGDHPFDVRELTVTDALSRPFEVDLVVRAPDADIDLASVVSMGASLRMQTLVAPGVMQSRTWNGFCSAASLLRVEPEGLSTYSLKIVPSLWRAKLRENCRIFQHKSVRDIVLTILAELDIEPRVDLAEVYPRLEYCVQYRETDFAFISRLMERAGITYYFAPDPPASPSEQWTPEHETRLVLTDRAPVPAEPLRRIPFTDSVHADVRHAFVTKVKVHHESRSAVVTLRSEDFRRPMDRPLTVQAGPDHAQSEAKYERYVYEHGAFVVEGPESSPPADAHEDEAEANTLAARKLAAHRGGNRAVHLSTNMIELCPGAAFAIDGHPRSELGVETGFIVSTSKLRGDRAGWEFDVQAVFASDPFVPAEVTPRPRIFGVQSAVVVGPRGEEIHTDSFGRCRVQFHWDREGQLDEHSSCWMRVSQAWAGSAYGTVTLPRVGQEVLVEFFDGDPDRPVVVGRVFNATTPVPYKLPEHKTRSGLKTCSSRGAGGFNELMFDDAKGRERLHIQAERDYSEVIKRDFASTVLASKSTNVGGSEVSAVGAHRTAHIGGIKTEYVGDQAVMHVGVDRAAFVGRMDIVTALAAHSTLVGTNGCGIQILPDEIVLTTGHGATLTLKGGAVFVDAVEGIQLTGGRIRADATQGGTCEINCGPSSLAGQPVGAEVHVKTLAPAAEPHEPRPPRSGGATIDAARVLTPLPATGTKPEAFAQARLGPPLVIDVALSTNE